MKKVNQMTNEEQFPFDQFPWKLTHKDGKETRKCYFQAEEHMNKHITRYNLKKKDYTTGYKYGTN
tara:strand:- start:919 stop:1113 length:195 start_codon:yes stop_codon:yes gene_type:complete